MKITDVVLDYDGTCTQIPLIYAGYLKRYLEELNKQVYHKKNISKKEWEDAQNEVRKKSPKAAWTINYTACAPAAADPYILAYESAKLISRNRNGGAGITPVREIHETASAANPAPWRKEAKSVFETLLKNNINIHFISNSSTEKITKELLELFKVKKLPAGIFVQSDAAKFSISELIVDDPQHKSSGNTHSIPKKLQLMFDKIPVAYKTDINGRPAYLRRGFYFEAICKAFNNKLDKLPSTIFCGDIWEMDLAMPYELGANIHLIEREPPFNTYTFERNIVKAQKGKVSKNLNGLLKWLN